nr:unnamed protein product [Spirometra erinaceieuropaei]
MFAIVQSEGRMPQSEDDLKMYKSGLAGAALGSSFQPFESHIPYLLQFCADFNLQGMNYLQASKFRLRGTRTKADALSESDIRLVDPLRFLWTENDGLLETQIHENCPERQTSTDVEVDISASDIMNNRDCNSNENINPGLDFLWAEERARRETIEELGVESVLTPVAAASLPKMPTPDGLLPLSATSTAPAKGAPAEEASPTGDLFYSQQSVNSSFTPSCGMSEQALDELCCLADLTEEADAPIHSQLLMSQLQETHFDLSSFLNASVDAGSLSKQASSLPVFRQVSKSYQKTVLAGDSEVDTSWVTSDGPFCTLSPDRSAPTSPTTGDANLTVDTLVARATLAASQYARSARSALFEEQDADELLAAPNCPPVQPGTDSAADEFEDFDDLFGEADNEDHFPVDDPAVFRDPSSPTAADIVESTFADGTLISYLPRLPQLDGVDDDSIIPDQRRRQHRRLGLRLSGRRLFPESPTDVGSLPTGTLSSTNDRFLSSPRVETQLSSKPAVDPKRRRLGMLSRTTVPPTVPILSLPPCRVVLQPLSETDMVGISTNTCNSSFFMTVPVTVQGPSFPSTYNSQHASSPCYAPHLETPSLVESQLADRKPTDEIRPISSQAKNPLEDSRVSDLDAKVDLSTSISDLWWSTLASRPRRLSAARNSTSRRALLPVQENHLCVASLEVLVRTRYRLRGEAEAPASRRMQVGRLVRETEAISLNRLGGYAPDPQLDAVLLACLCFQKPRAACELFVLLNRADAGALGTSESLLHRLLPTRRTNLPVTSRLLLCSGEMELLNWTACLVQRAGGESFNFGCLEHSVTPEDLKLVGDYVTVAPNGVCFVKRDILEGVLPRLWRGLLSSRLMVKDSMKLYIGDESLKRLLDARQLGLKLIANVIYGYTAASFSGRMPCVEVGDSIVHKGRETLERAIQLVETGFGVPPGTPTPWLTGGGCDAKVIYGDTDSLFVKLPHCDKATSFRLGQAMADAVSQANPAPIKLKLEKVFFPCILEAKKRYVGYAYESAEQATAVFDAKGIETVRRDSAPFVGKVLESSLRLLFDQFRIWDEPPDLARVELKIRAKVRNFATRLINGRIPFSSCILARAYLGQTGYRPGACAPALQVARRLMSVDANFEPLVGERVTYYIAPGKPSEALIGGVRAAQEAWPLIFFNEGERTVSCRRAPAPSLNLAFYLDHQLLPPIARFAELLGWNVQAWLHDLPRLLATSVTGSAMTTSQTGHFPLQIRTTPLSATDESSVCQSSQLLPHHTSTPCVTTRQRGSGRNQQPSSVLQTFLKRPKICPGCGFTVKMRTDPSGVTTQKSWGHCEQCLLVDPSLPVRSLIALGAEMNSLMTRLQLSERVCTACIGLRSAGPVSWCCSNLACANRDRRCQLIRDMGRVTSRFPTDFPSFETFSSWSPLPP